MATATTQWEENFVSNQAESHISSRGESPGLTGAIQSTKSIDHIKSSKLPVSILGIPFDNLTLSEAVQAIHWMIQSRRPHYVVTANIDFLVQSLSDIELRRVLWDANLVLCDGTPLLWISKIFGNRICQRVAGSDLVPELLNLCSRHGYRVFFLGGTEEVANKAAENVRRNYPGIKIAGVLAPPFLPLLEMDHDSICEQIKKSYPDLLLVSFSCPKSEKWFFMNYRRVGVPVGIGVGASIDFLAGKFLRAPHWMRRTGLEWLFRLIQEPRRLWKRYSKDFVVFGGALIKQGSLLKGYYRRISQKRRNLIAEVCRKSHVEIISPPCLDVQTVRAHLNSWRSGLIKDAPCIVNMAATRAIDSTGIGFLIGLHRQVKQKGGRLIIYSPTPEVLKVIELLHLKSLFSIVNSEDEIREMLRKPDRGGFFLQITGSVAKIYCDGELMAANASDFLDFCQRHLEVLMQRELVIDLLKLEFIDSSGVGALVRLKKLAQNMGISLKIENPSDNVRNVLEITKLFKFLCEL